MRDKTPGNKFYDWELKGVPLRIEIGPRDVEKGVITLVARDGLKKEIKRSGLDKIKQEMSSFNSRLFEQAKKFLDENIHTLAKTYILWTT